MYKQIITIGVFVTVCLAEVAVQSGPYPPSGWKPQGAPFTLPKDFLPQQQGQSQFQNEQQPVGQFQGGKPQAGQFQNSRPQPGQFQNRQQLPGQFQNGQPQPGQFANGQSQAGSFQNRQQQETPKSEVEITEENVEYAGQNIQADSATTPVPSNGYLPPEAPEENTDEGATEDYLKVQGLPQPQAGQFTPVQNGQFNQVRGQYRNQPARQFGQLRAQSQFGRQTAFNPQQAAAVQTTTSSYPALVPREYGPPKPNSETAEPAPGAENTEPETESNSNENDEPISTVAVSNAVSNGRYYILTPDNTLQRVVFMTSQSDDEAKINGFTAELRYMPVEPIRDPVYAYNEQGQLIRIYNK